MIYQLIKKATYLVCAFTLSAQGFSSLLFVPGLTNKNVGVIDTVTNSKIAVIDLSATNGPLSIAVNQRTGKVYVGLASGIEANPESLAVINATTFEIEGYIGIGQGNIFSIAINETTNTACVVSGLAPSSAVVVDLENEATAVISLTGQNLQGAKVAIDETTNRAYVTARNTTDTSGQLAIIDLETSSFDSAIPLNTGDAIENVDGIGINPTTQKAYIRGTAVMGGVSSVAIVDLQTETKEANLITLNHGNNNGGVGIGVATNRGYFPDQDEVPVVLLETPARLTDIVLNSDPAVSGPIAIVIDPLTQLAYVAGDTSSNIGILSLVDNVKTGAISLTTGPLAQVTDLRGLGIYVIDTSTEDGEEEEESIERFELIEAMKLFKPTSFTKGARVL